MTSYQCVTYLAFATLLATVQGAPVRRSAHDAENCPFNAQVPATCWANSAFQKCPYNRVGAYHAVMAFQGSMKQMHNKYTALVAGGAGCTRPHTVPFASIRRDGKATLATTRAQCTQYAQGLGKTLVPTWWSASRPRGCSVKAGPESVVYYTAISRQPCNDNYGCVEFGDVEVVRRPNLCLRNNNFKFCKMTVDGMDFSRRVINYPIDGTTCDALKGTDAVSPQLVTDVGVVDNVESLLQIDGAVVFKHYPPTFPDSEGDAGRTFWKEFQQVVRLQKQRVSAPSTPAAQYLTLGLPGIMDTWTMETAAQEVRSDFPTHFPTLLVQDLLGGTYGDLAIDGTIFANAANANFIHKEVMLARMIGWSVSAVSPTAFQQKWKHGRPRPEEVAIAAKAGVGKDWAADPMPGVDAATQALLDGLNFEDMEAFTAYGEEAGASGSRGSPKHPSYPAMHSAASTSSLYLAVVLDLTDEQHMEAIKLDCAVASFRTYAGVHYESDNQAGLAMGQSVIAKLLPAMLAEAYGADKGHVEDKIKRVLAKWDWRREVMQGGVWDQTTTTCLDTTSLKL